MVARRQDFPPRSVRDALADWWRQCTDADHQWGDGTLFPTGHWPAIQPVAVFDELPRQLAALQAATKALDGTRTSTTPWLRLAVQAAERKVTVARCTLRGELFGLLPWWQTYAVATCLPRPTPVKIALVSSHLPSPLENQHRWFTALRTAMSLPIPGAVYLVGARSTVAPWAERWAQCSGRKLWVIRYLRPETAGSGTPGHMLWRALAECTVSEDPIGKIFLIPPVAQRQEGQIEQPPWKWQLKRAVDDAAACALADLIVVLHLDPKGRIACILERASRCASPPRVWLAGEYPSRKLHAIFHGASNVVPWCTCDSVTGNRSFHFGSQALVRIQATNSLSALGDEPYLIHWTRSAEGPWPGQSLAAYQDDFLLDRASKFRSSLDVLLRILRSRCIAASSRAIRGGYRVVCFADVSLEELKNRRIFRTHRHRWDFNPYGIAILRRCLEDVGAKPVIYGDECRWRDLPTELRPFFQKARSRSGQYDWTSEREWRMVGDCNLEGLPTEAVRVIVANATEARVACYFSRWPVLALEPPTSQDDVTFIW